MGSKCLLPHLKEICTGSYPEPVESSPQFYDQFKIRFKSILTPTAKCFFVHFIIIGLITLDNKIILIFVKRTEVSKPNSIVCAKLKYVVNFFLSGKGFKRRAVEF